jgi:hypothetical protein
MTTPSAIPPVVPVAGRSGSRAAVAIALAGACLTVGVRAAGAQAVRDTRTGLEFMVASGRLMPTGSQRDVVKRGNLTAAQLWYVVRPGLAITTSFGWTRSRDIASVGDPRLDVFSYDLGVEARAHRWRGGKAVTFSPFVGVGAGGRSYNYRSLNVDARHNLAAYGSVGGELGYWRVRLRLEVRDYVTGFKPLLGGGASARRNDVALMVGFRLAGR